MIFWVTKQYTQSTPSFHTSKTRRDWKRTTTDTASKKARQDWRQPCRWSEPWRQREGAEKEKKIAAVAAETREAEEAAARRAGVSTDDKVGTPGAASGGSGSGKGRLGGKEKEETHLQGG